MRIDVENSPERSRGMRTSIFPARLFRELG